ncbi:MAG TPA: antibiotic biosynthesis monooxygenase [Chloroflexota bacterium]|nr:antibiotic biosynthesis monooxygenase [Chloroflexota bacterium]
MRITVMTRRWARPGQEEALLAASMAQMAQIAPQRQTEESGQVFQGLLDPRQMLYLATWPNREAYLHHTEQSAIDARLDPLCAEPPRRYLLRRWVAYQNPRAHATAMECVLIVSPPGQHEVTRAFVLRDAGPRIRTMPGFCYRRVYQDLDTPDHLVIVRGWDSPAAWQHFRSEIEPMLDLASRRFGATLEHFVGVVQREFGSARSEA